jgi:glutamine synthetase
MDMTPLPGSALARAAAAAGFGDLELRPDLSTLRAMTWRDKAAVVICDVVPHAPAPTEAPCLSAVAPRSLLKQQLARAHRLGFAVTAATELEYFLLDCAPAALGRGVGFSPAALLPLLPARASQDYQLLQAGADEPLARAMRSHLNASAVPVEGSKGEAAPGQHELNTAHCGALEAADRAALFKLCVKDVARAAGKTATFMAKPFAHLAGSGCHLHVNLRRIAPTEAGTSACAGAGTGVAGSSGGDGNEGSNAFTVYDHPLSRGGDNDTGHASHSGGGGGGSNGRDSAVLAAFLGGLTSHAASLMPLWAPTANSYKRLAAAAWAPAALGWAEDSRAAAFRLVGRGESRRIEVRLAGADANPYLALAAVVAAGCDGIERGLVCPARASVDSSGGGDNEAAAAAPLPLSLPRALELWSAPDSFPRRAFGAAVAEHVAAVVGAEARAHELSVSDWERERYLEQA